MKKDPFKFQYVDFFAKILLILNTAVRKLTTQQALVQIHVIKTKALRGLSKTAATQKRYARCYGLD